MTEQVGFLFDLDGVIIDTEPIYDLFWRDAAVRYRIGIKQFEQVIKGTTMPNIMKKYFSGYTREECDRLVNECAAFESRMDIPEVGGSVAFIELLKKEGFKTALVTSSELHKLERVFEVLPIKGLFDTIVTAERVKHGKPSPDCFILAAQELGVDASKCIVFEDSVNGIKAGNAARAKVIGVTTSHSSESLKETTFDTIPDFKNVGLEEVRRWSGVL